ncbi:MAG TPA: hypothetical protein VGI66_17040 [Streptosporangiaceae bacterium]
MRALSAHRPSASMIVALTALVVALTGTAFAAARMSGDKLIKKHSLSGSRLRNHTLTGTQINMQQLGTVPSAKTAKNASAADVATNASHATNSDELGGSLASAWQSRVTGSCSASSAIEQINADGSVACGNVQFYSGCLVEAAEGPSATFLTIPGIAHAAVLNCLSSNANAALVKDPAGTTDLWYNGDSSYLGGNWVSAGSPLAPTGGATWHLGQGSGTGAKVITVTVSTEATGSQCILQGTAEVITAS